MERTLEDPDIEEIMEKMVQEHGEENIKFELKDKTGHDGTTIETTKVSMEMKISNLNWIVIFASF